MIPLNGIVPMAEPDMNPLTENDSGLPDGEMLSIRLPLTLYLPVTAFTESCSILRDPHHLASPSSEGKGSVSCTRSHGLVRAEGCCGE